MDLDNKTVSASSYGSPRKWNYFISRSRSMTWVDDNGEVADSLDCWNHRDIQGAPSVVSKRPDTTLTQYDLVVTLI